MWPHKLHSLFCACEMVWGGSALNDPFLWLREEQLLYTNDCQPDLS